MRLFCVCRGDPKGLGLTQKYTSHLPLEVMPFWRILALENSQKSQKAGIKNSHPSTKDSIEK